MGVSSNGGIKNGLVSMDNPIEMDDLGVPPFQETSILGLYNDYEAWINKPVGCLGVPWFMKIRG